MSGAQSLRTSPGHDEATLRVATGRGWTEWRVLIDSWPDHVRGHSAIAAHLREAHGVDDWWAQAITVGYERLTGRRQLYQQPDGSFTASASATLRADPSVLRARLLDAGARHALFPGIATEVRSRAQSKNVRLVVGPGTAEIELRPMADGRTKVTVNHARLPEFEDAVHWKAWWKAWLQQLDVPVTLQRTRRSTSIARRKAF